MECENRQYVHVINKGQSVIKNGRKLLERKMRMVRTRARGAMPTGRKQLFVKLKKTAEYQKPTAVLRGHAVV
jgi:hypothetical protein